MARIIDISEVLLPLGLSDTVTDEERAVANAAIIKAENAVKKYIRYDPTLLSRTEYYPQQRFRGSGYRRWESNDTHAYIRQLSEGSTDELLVRHIPIRTSVAVQLWIDYDARSGTRAGSFGAATLQTEGTDYWPNYDMEDSNGDSVCSDGIIRSMGLWPTEPGTVRITYTAGYNDVEMHGQDLLLDGGPIADAVVEEACRHVRKVMVSRKSSGVGWVAGLMNSEKLGDYSYSVDGALLLRLFGPGDDLMGESKEKLEPFVNMGYTIGG